MTGEPLLSVRALTKRYGGVVANSSIFVDVGPREIRAVIGPNGAGKTTFLDQISGEIDPDEGTILFDGHDITSNSVEKRAQLGLMRTYQMSSVMPTLTVYENALLGALAHNGRRQRLWGAPGHDDRAARRARAALEQVGITDDQGAPAHSLSHGMRRKLEIAIALATEPKMLLLDEPTAGMGAEDSERMIELLQTLGSQYAILLVEHDMDVVFAVCESITVLNGGLVIADGSPADVRNNAAVREAYLGA